MEEEWRATRRSLEDLKGEMRIPYDDTKQHVDMLEAKLKITAEKIEDFSMSVFTTMQNICISLQNPLDSQSTD